MKKKCQNTHIVSRKINNKNKYINNTPENIKFGMKFPLLYIKGYKLSLSKTKSPGSEVCYVCCYVDIRLYNVAHHQCGRENDPPS